MSNNLSTDLIRALTEFRKSLPDIQFRDVIAVLAVPGLLMDEVVAHHGFEVINFVDNVAVVDKQLLLVIYQKLCHQHGVAPEELPDQESSEQTYENKPGVSAEPNVVPDDVAHQSLSEVKSQNQSPHCVVDQKNLAVLVDEIDSLKYKKGRSLEARLKLLHYLHDHSTCACPMPQKRQIKALQNLAIDFPNFTEVVTWAIRQLKLALRVKMPIRFPPFLLVGLPGTGKTQFVVRFAHALGMHYAESSVAVNSASFILKGSHRTWSDPNPGRIFDAFMHRGKSEGCVFLLDEVDKLASDRRYPMDPVLLELLEPSQTDRFRDEFVDITMNITPFFNWVCTANDLSRMSDPLKSRLMIFLIPLPSASQMPAIVESVDRTYRASRKEIAKVFSPLSVDVKKCFGSYAVRDLRRALECAYGIAVDEAKGRGRISITVDQAKRAMAVFKHAAQEIKLGNQYEDPEIMVMSFRPKSGGNTPPTILH